MKKFLALALKIATHSDNTWQHGAVLVKSGRVIAHAPNVFKNEPMIFQIEYGEDEVKQKQAIRDHCSVHAEERVLKMAGEAARGSIIYVARVNRRGEPLMSRPCDHCYNAMVEAGVKTVVYTETPGERLAAA